MNEERPVYLYTDNALETRWRQFAGGKEVSRSPDGYENEQDAIREAIYEAGYGGIVYLMPGYDYVDDENVNLANRRDVSVRPTLNDAA